MHGAAIGHGQHRHGKHQHAHAAHPVGEAAPEQRAVAQGFHVGQDGGAGGGKAGDGLEESVNKGRYFAGNHKGQCAEGTHQHPDQRHDGQAVAGKDGGVFGGLAAGDEPQHRQQRGRQQKCRQQIPLVVEHGADQREKHQTCFDCKDAAQHKGNHSIIHAGALTLRCRAGRAGWCRW